MHPERILLARDGANLPAILIAQSKPPHILFRILLLKTSVRPKALSVGLMFFFNFNPSFYLLASHPERRRFLLPFDYAVLRSGWQITKYQKLSVAVVG
jgi:hypothetical protein